jgi:Raf kinase inhibitor-like YbhB/YbcL family protein
MFARMNPLKLLPTLAAGFLLLCCDRPQHNPQTTMTAAARHSTAASLGLRSSAFEAGASIPKRNTCEGENVSPQLSWDTLPEGTRALAIVCDDPDAPRGTWVHWVLYCDDADRTSFDDAFARPRASHDGVHEGRNSFDELGYSGPCPPPGKPHHYSFRLYALDARIALPASFDKAALTSAIEGHVIATAELIGVYFR